MLENLDAAREDRHRDVGAAFVTKLQDVRGKLEGGCAAARYGNSDWPAVATGKALLYRRVQVPQTVDRLDREAALWSLPLSFDLGRLATQIEGERVVGDNRS